MGKSDANERNESSLSNCRVQPALSIKEGRVDFRKNLRLREDWWVFENFLIPLYHALSLFLPGKLHLSFLTILRKEPQQRSVLFKLIEKFGEITSRLKRRRKRNLPTNLIIHSITLTTSIKTNDRKIIANSLQNDMRSTLSNTGKEENIRLLHDALHLIMAYCTMPDTLISNAITLCQ